MTVRRTNSRRRFAVPARVRRRRRRRFDYGLLVVMPFLAAAGGVLLSLAIEKAVEHRRAPAPDPSGADEAPARVSAET